VSEKITVTYDVLARDMVSVVRITFSECHWHSFIVSEG
jgi:hypothetical protein